MADYLADVYPLPVEFNDGQQPTAAFFNAWADQIDRAFVLLGRVLGDFDGTGDAYETYVTNIIRSFGTMGWINNRLPRNLRLTPPAGVGPSSDLPAIAEELVAPNAGRKVGLLTFAPAADEATDGNDLITVTVDGGELTNPQNKGVGSLKYQDIDSTGDWLLDGRRIVTYDPIDASSTITYAVDTDSDDYRDAYGSDQGSNVIPSMYEITSSLTALCTITQPGGYSPNQYRIDFPEVRRVQNPATPFADGDDALKLDDAGSTVRWSGTAPKYTIPSWIYLLAQGAGDEIPGGLVGLWHDDGSSISRVRSVVNTDSITFEIITGEESAVKITLNGTMSLPATGYPNGTGFPADTNHNRYILAFAGTSVTDALVHERSRMLLHKHDGEGDDSLISAEHLTDRFNPSNYFHSHTESYNWYPQYLDRGGYNALEVSNRKNALLGDLLIGASTASPSALGVDPEDITSTSHSIYFADASTGPRIIWDVSDSTGPSPDDEGKLVFFNKPVRSEQRHYFGPNSYSSSLVGTMSGSDEILVHGSSAANEYETVFQTGKLHLRGGIIEMDTFDASTSTGYIRLTDASIGTFAFTLFDSLSAPQDFILDISNMEVGVVSGEAYEVELPMSNIQITANGGWTSPFVDSAAGDYTENPVRIEQTSGGNPATDPGMELLIEIPHPNDLGIQFDSGSYAIKTIELNVTGKNLLLPAAGTTSDLYHGATKLVSIDNTVSASDSVTDEGFVSVSPPSLASANPFNRQDWTLTEGTAVTMSTDKRYYLGVFLGAGGAVAGGTATWSGISGVRVTYEGV